MQASRNQRQLPLIRFLSSSLPFSVFFHWRGYHRFGLTSHRILLKRNLVCGCFQWFLVMSLLGSDVKQWLNHLTSDLYLLCSPSCAIVQQPWPVSIFFECPGTGLHTAWVLAIVTLNAPSPISQFCTHLLLLRTQPRWEASSLRVSGRNQF